MIILGIETSCDETAAALIEAQKDNISVLSSIVSSQVILHSQWGGVVPNLAAREHLKNILPVIEKTFKKAQKRFRNIDLVTVTNGPGLIPALLIGTNAAKSLSYAFRKPLVGIHHIEGHIYANFIGEIKSEKVIFPLLCLVVSGGHTQLILMKNHLDYEIVGETQDDAAGEAFDKVARILNLGYPGGPIVAQRAQKFKNQNQKKTQNIKLPRPMINSDNLDFSFSGLKTAVLYLTKKNAQLLKDDLFVNEACHEFQQAVIDVLIKKTIKAARKYQPQTVMIAGGVSANLELKKQMEKALKKDFPQIIFRVPELGYSVDNAAMIATAGYFRWQRETNKKVFLENWKELKTDANLKLK